MPFSGKCRDTQPSGPRVEEHVKIPTLLCEGLCPPVWKSLHGWNPSKGSTLPASGKVLVVEQCQRAIALQQFWGETIRARILMRIPFQGLGDRVENENCKVRELEKVRFGEKKSETSTLQEDTTLGEGEGAAVRSAGCCAKSRRGWEHTESISVWRCIILRGSVFLIIILIS